MSGARSLSAIATCSSCRLNLLESLVALSGTSIAPLRRGRTRPSFFPPKPSVRATPARTFTSHGRYRAEYGGETRNLFPPEGKDTQELPVQEEADQRPWYLRVQDEQGFEPQHLERQKLPNIPKDSPECLPAIVDQLSRDIGLDWLSIIDLRELEPPPALGSNLIMVLGTARSEKHLNVAADRLCRWLRSKLKFQPKADGLIGRNELKIKLRRKARRAKLLGGRSQVGTVDDGISTGWICVDVGPINNGEQHETVLESDDGAVTGFGQIDSRVKLVVQILTEERRAELALEDLWNGFVNRQRRKEVRDAREEGLALAEPEEPGPDLVDMDSQSAHHSSPVERNTDSKSAARTVLGIRSFSSLARQQQALQAAMADTVPIDTSTLSQGHTKVETTLSKLARNQPKATDLKHRRNVGQDNAKSLSECLRKLNSLPQAEAVTALGQGCEDRSSTPFLREFYGNIGLFPGPSEWLLRLQLIYYAQLLRHPKYTVAEMLSVLQEMEESCIEIPTECYQLVIKALGSEPSRSSNNKESTTSPTHLETILELLENMTFRKLPTISEETVSGLAGALWSNAVSSDDSSRPKVGERAAADTLLLALDSKVRVEDEELHIMAMQELANLGDWPTFWIVWRSFPMRELSRSSNLYAAMFRLIAASRHQNMCIETVTTWAEEMRHERPPVKLEGRVALAIMACLKVIDPYVDAKVREGTDVKDEWVKLFKECYSSFIG